MSSNNPEARKAEMLAAMHAAVDLGGDDKTAVVVVVQQARSRGAAVFSIMSANVADPFDVADVLFSAGTSLAEVLIPTPDTPEGRTWQ